MANQIFNSARLKAGYYLDPALGLSGANSRLVIIALEAAEADDTLNNYSDLGALLGAAGNTEATSTNYSRIELASADVTFTVDDTGNTAQIKVDVDQTWSTVSQSGSESWVKLLIAYDPDNTVGTDADLLLMTHHDFSVTPNGGDITADFAPEFLVSS